jgi:hypothetical protein
MDLSSSDEPREHGWILIRGRLKHLPGGHFEDSFMPAPLEMWPDPESQSEAKRTSKLRHQNCS